MALKTGEEYKQSLRQMKPRVYLLGERLERPWEHPIIEPSQNAVAMTYDLAHEPEFRDLMTVTSRLSGQRVNRFTHLHENPDDILKKVKMLRLLGQRTASCFQRCTTVEGFNPLHIVTWEIDQKYGTDYHRRFLDFVRFAQEEDLALGVAMTDVKGDRSLRPGEQADADLHLHVVEEGKEGIVVRGAKAHHTGAVNCHYTMVLPTRAMRGEDRDYAVGFVIPVDAEGVVHLYSRQASDTRRMEPGDIDRGNATYDGQTALVVFDDVFVPWERVFIYKQHEFCGRLANLFGAEHRCSYGGCKAGVMDVLIGATALMADYHGIGDVPHVRSKLNEMVQVAETVYACGVASASEAHVEPSGIYMNEPMLGNVCKLNVSRAVFQVSQLAVDITGGILGTMPSHLEYAHPEVRPYMEKYLKGSAEFPTEHKMRIIRLIENLLFGSNATTFIVESVHGAGSPEMQKMLVERLAGLDDKKHLARVIAGIERG